MDADSDTKSDTVTRAASETNEEKRRSLLLWDEYRRFHETAPIGYFTLDRDGVILNVNVAGAKLLSTAPTRLMGKRLADFMADASCYPPLMKSLIERDDWQQCEVEIIRTDGSRFFALVQARRVALAGEVIVFATDVTERTLAERALRESEQKYRDVADRLAEGIFETDNYGKVTYANKKALASLGLGESDLRRGLNVFGFISPRSLDVARGNFGRVLEQVDVGASEYELVRKDGTTFPALVHSLAVTSEGEVTGVRGILVDISERKRAELALQESERKYRELADLLGAGVFEADCSGNLVYGNRKGLAYYGLDENDVKNGFNIFNVISPAELKVAGENFARVLSQEDIGPIEYTMLKRDGTSFPGLTHVTAIVRDGAVVGVRGVVVDISERKRTENALRESERKYRELADQLDEGVYEIDPSGTITYANRKGLAYLGITDDDLKTGVNGFDLIVHDDPNVVRERYGRTLKGEDIGAVEYVFRRKDGTTFTGLTHSSAIFRDGAIVGVRGVIIDISDLKRAEQALKESEQRFRTLLKSLHEGIWALDKNDNTTFVNPRMAEMLGYTEEEMLGRPVYSFNDDEWKKFTAEKMERRKRGVSEQLEGELVRKDGGRVYALFETSPIMDQDGNYAGSIAGVQDITARKLGEEKLRQTMAELDRSNKELEQFAYVTSHDLREPLRMMTSFSQSLEKRYKDKLDSTANEYIHFIVDGATRMQKLIDDILVYSRVTTRAQPFAPVDMEKVLDDALFSVKAAVQEAGAEVTHDPLPVVKADASQMAQVLQNLLGNAVKFSREGVSPKVHVSAKKDDGAWLFSVQDNGIGIDPELFGRLFNLFQRLHPPDKYPGTGVGLAVTKKIVERHGGRIWVESGPGQGSVFHFTIPERD